MTHLTLPADDALGPLGALLDDPNVMEILVNGPQHIFVERGGRLAPVAASFADEAQLLHAVQVLTGVEHTPNTIHPIAEFRLPDESTVTVVGPPVALTGLTVVYRRGVKRRLSLQDLLRFEGLSQEMATFLAACVRARLNIIVSGGSGSGKTTIANVLCSLIPPEERVITVEEQAELVLDREHLVRLVSRPPAPDGTGGVTLRELVELVMKMRPDRIAFGELRGPETWPVIQALNSGADGSIAIIHAIDPRDALARIELQVALAEPSMLLPTLRQQIAGALHVIVQANRLPDGSRRLTTVSEVQGIERETIALRDLFVFEQTGIDMEGRIIGRYRATGVRSGLLERLAERQVLIDEAIFDPPIDMLETRAEELGSADVPALDAQLGETTMLLALLLRAGYSVMQAFDLLAHELPAPVAIVLNSALSEVSQGAQPFTALALQTTRTPSIYLRALADTIERQYNEGGNLAELLEPLAESIRQQAGDDPAIDEVGMRIRRHVGAPTRA
jgi:pilus assembly protein CpaF